MNPKRRAAEAPDDGARGAGRRTGALARWGALLGLLASVVVPSAPAAADFVSGVFAVGTSPNSVVTGDFDADGRLDVATADTGSATVSVLRGEPDRRFVPGARVAVGSSPFDLATGDFDGNAATDLAVASLAANQVSVLLGNPDGTLTAAPALSVGPGAGPAAVVVLDSNGDGRADIAVANYGANTVSVFLGRGDGGFDAGGTHDVGDNPIALATADFDGNATTDLAVANSESKSVSILMGDGAGGFSASLLGLPTENFSFPSAVTAADFTGDGRSDLAVSSFEFEADEKADKVYIFPGSGDGGFGAPATYAAGRNPRGLAGGDFDEDGRADLAIAAAGEGSFESATNVRLSSNDFGDPASYGVGLGARDVTVADLDGDAKLDLASANFGSDSVSVVYGGLVPGTFATAPGYFTGSPPVSLATADVNGDGTPDIVSANSNTDGPQVSVVVGVGDGSFRPPLDMVSDPGTYPTAVGVGDMNGDGRVDLVVVNSGGPPGGCDATREGSVTVFLGNGDGTFARLAPFPAGGRCPSSLAVSDLDGDGRQDVAVVYRGVDAVAVLWGRGDGTFEPLTAHQVPGSASAVAAGDLSGDGRPDLAVTTSPGGMTVLVGGPSRTFTTSGTHATGASPTSVIVTDLNRDARGDVAVANAGSDTVSVLLSTGAGVLAPAVEYDSAGTSSWVGTGDFNLDGITDLLVANQSLSVDHPFPGAGVTAPGAGTIAVLLGRGDGTFNDPLPYAAGSRTASAAVADYNGDGRLDVAVPDFNAGAVAILLGVPDTAPTSPTDVQATAGDGSAEVRWGLPVHHGGSNITGYTLTAYSAGVPVTTATAGAGSSQVVVGGLANGTTYTFTVAATNAVGTSNESAPSNPVVPGAADPAVPVDPPPPPPPPPSGNGYWLVASDGGIFAFGDAPFHGSTGAIRLNQPVVGMAPTPSGNGYWLVASDGGIFAFGDAPFHGSTGAIRLNQPVVGMAPTPSGDGYWLVASDGGIFAFGDARFHGSTGAIRLNQPVVGMAPTPSGNGYWLVASDGGIFAFGDARFHGSTGAIRLNQPVVGMAPTPSGNGYWLVASDGGIFAFGDAGYHGSTGGIPINQPVVTMAPTPTGRGYWLTASDGGVFAFGDAAFAGSMGGTRLNRPVVGSAPRPPA